MVTINLIRPRLRPERNPALRLAALRDSPAPFKNRNLLTPTVDLPLNLRAGRPTKSVVAGSAGRDRTNAEQKRNSSRLLRAA